MMNKIINELISKQFQMLSDEQADAEIFRTIHEIESKYILLNTTKKAIDLAKGLNETLGYEFNYKPSKMAIGMTFYEILLKAISFRRDDPFSYIKEQCVVIPKNEDVYRYLDGVKIIHKLSEEKDPELTSNEIKLYSLKFKERNDKRFNDKLNKLIDIPNITLYSRGGGYFFNNGYTEVEIKVSLPGNEEDSRINWQNNNSPMQQKADNIVENFTESLFGRKLKVKRTEYAVISRKLLDEFDGDTIFRTNSLIFEKGKKLSKSSITNQKHFQCTAGLFLNYDQYCDMIIKGNLK